MTCPHCKCQTYMNPCPQCGENTNRPNYAGYSKPAQRRVAIESLERWEAQMEDLVRSGCFGIHVAEGCTACRAGHLIQGMIDLRRMLERASCLPNSVLGRSEQPEPVRAAEGRTGDSRQSGETNSDGGAP